MTPAGPVIRQISVPRPRDRPAPRGQRGRRGRPPRRRGGGDAEGGTGRAASAGPCAGDCSLPALQFLQGLPREGRPRTPAPPWTLRGGGARTLLSRRASPPFGTRGALGDLPWTALPRGLRYAPPPGSSRPLRPHPQAESGRGGESAGPVAPTQWRGVPPSPPPRRGPRGRGSGVKGPSYRVLGVLSAPPQRLQPGGELRGGFIDAQVARGRPRRARAQQRPGPRRRRSPGATGGRRG